MNILMGTVLYQSDLTLVLNLVRMMARQSIFSARPDVRVQWVFLDNDNGVQLQEAERRIRALASEPGISESFIAGIRFLSSSNIGFGGGHNHIAQTVGAGWPFDYYLCLNPDGIPHPEMLRHLVEFAERNEGKGVYEARQFPVEHPKVYDPKTGVTEWASGCCLLIPAPLYRALNGFDSSFFLYMEDVDLSWRTRLLGGQCYVVPEALFCHYKDNTRDVREEQKQMMLSAFTLGCKYKNGEFANYAYLQLREIMSEEALHQETERVRMRMPEYASYSLQPFMVFTNGFYFSPVRWYRC